MLTALLALQTQSARFLPPTPLLTELGAISVAGGHASPTVADLDGDGLEDLIVGQFDGGRFNVFINSGSPSKHIYKVNKILQAGDEPAGVSYGCCIGSTPVFADLDGDGTRDLVSGSYTNGVLVFHGLGKGAFDLPEPVLDENKYPLKPDVSIAPALADFDGDGDLDIVMGSQSGFVFLPLNNGSMRFSTPQKLTWDGKEIVAQHGGPALFDFNNDGVLDLLIGDLFGNLTLYNGRIKGGIDFAPGKSVLPAFPKDPRPGIRLKPFVTDWNRDGKPDILVGDHRPDSSPVVALPANVQEEIEKLHLSISTSAFAIFTRNDELQQIAKKEVGVINLAEATAEQRAKYDAALARLTTTDKKLADLEAQKSAAEQRITLLSDQKPNQGTVWIIYGI